MAISHQDSVDECKAYLYNTVEQDRTFLNDISVEDFAAAWDSYAKETDMFITSHFSDDLSEGPDGSFPTVYHSLVWMNRPDLIRALEGKIIKGRFLDHYLYAIGDMYSCLQEAIVMNKPEIIKAICHVEGLSLNISILHNLERHSHNAEFANYLLTPGEALNYMLIYLIENDGNVPVAIREYIATNLNELLFSYA